MSIKRIIAKTINAAIAVNKTSTTAGIVAIISPIVKASKTDKTKIIKSMQHLFFLALQPL